MKVGTKSLLFGVHCFFLHPIFVFLAWWKLYGFPWDPRLWVAFIVHDWGYWGKPNMDGPEGEEHVVLGAKIMHFLFDWKLKVFYNPVCHVGYDTKWHDFCLYHSRFYAKRNNRQYSKLCVADKFSFSMTPRWLYIPMASWSGEIYEYMAVAKKYNDSKFGEYLRDLSKGTTKERKIKWHQSVKEYMTEWAIQHKDIKEDTWTNAERNEVRENGVY